MEPEFATDSKHAIPLQLVERCEVAKWLNSAPSHVANWSAASQFRGEPGEVLLIPDNMGRLEAVAAIWNRNPGHPGANLVEFAALLSRLPSGEYAAQGDLSAIQLDDLGLAALFCQYRFDRYKANSNELVRLVAPDRKRAKRLKAIATGEFLTRNLINTPASDMGPEELEHAFRELSESFDAGFNAIVGDKLLRGNFPMIHAVGRASASEPRLLDMVWGDESNPKLTIVGKGVCFDTGGLNLKTGLSMSLMKKDMGGAAVAAGLAKTVMSLNLPVRLRVLVPVAENSVSSGSIRPGDVLRSRLGPSVEVTNTDAEGRLVLADALALADLERPDLMICVATLTGAARVALGPEVVPVFTNDDGLANALVEAGSRVGDSVWWMPLWPPYEKMLKSELADLVNAPQSGFAGSITAALFLNRFVKRARKFAHFDIYGWRQESKPGFPTGGVGQASRAVLEALPEVLGI